MAHPAHRRTQRRKKTAQACVVQGSPASRGNPPALALVFPSLLRFGASLIVAASLAVVLPTSAGATFRGPNGKIAYFQPPGEIFVMNSDGTEKTNVSNHPANDSQPAWSPGGDRIAFATNRDGNQEIYVMNADGSEQRNLTNHPAVDDVPNWTADGRILFFSTRDGNREVYMMNADGSGQTNLTQSPSSDWLAAGSPHGKRFAFASDRTGDFEIFTMRIGGGRSRQLTDSPGEDSTPSWSPSNNDIVFTSSRDGNPELYVMHANGRHQRRLTTTPAQAELGPVWSPDGEKITFTGCVALGTPAQRCEVYVMNSDGTGVTQLTTERGAQSDWQAAPS